MDNLMERNIYDVKGNVLICGACLPRMEKKAFNELIKDFDTVMYLCLEKEHINMAITKICGMLSTGFFDICFCKQKPTLYTNAFY